MLLISELHYIQNLLLIIYFYFAFGGAFIKFDC